MPKKKYLSIYLGEEGEDIVKALDRLAKKTEKTRNVLIKTLLMNFTWLAGELYKEK